MVNDNGKADSYVFRSWLDAAAVVDEKLHGPLPDVVSTQGHHLKPHPDTPVFEREVEPQFVEKLNFLLAGLLFGDTLRRRKYGDEVVDEWPDGHTPTEIREQWKSEQEADERRVQALLEIPTPPTPGDTCPPWESPTTARKRNLEDVSPSSSDSFDPPTPVPSRKRRKYIRSKPSFGQRNNMSTKESHKPSKAPPRPAPYLQFSYSLDLPSPESPREVT
ncbi:hypothetical protein FQN49_002053 [Arthroderma sp. PD_2]|nr:hypothetical protein FQN49_002053 [Arthroderma sp. PD_2]